MTYLELVNAVLSRMREDTLTTITTADDVVALIVMDLVNDAKRLVEDAHTWNSQRTEWNIVTVADTANYALTGSGNYAKIEYILSDNGQPLYENTLYNLKKKSAAASQTDKPQYYAVNGVDASNDVQLMFYPTPDAAYTYAVSGFQRQADLALDGDVLTVPAKPVLYYALALAARERGEVGGQSSAEIFAMANRYLSDAVAWDASLSTLDDIWTTV